MSYSIFHKDTEISFSVERRNRKSITIQVHPDSCVRVLAPNYSTRRYILKLVSSKADWILKKQREFSAKPVITRPEYKSGEVFSLLGESYILKLVHGKASVRIEGNLMFLTVPKNSSKEQKQKILQNWYKEQSLKIFPGRMEICIKQTNKIGIKTTPEWKSRLMKRSWGSCTGKNKIHLNQALAAVPVDCIDYVILHELCHLVEHNHSKRYYLLLNKICPDWKQKKAILNREYNPYI